MGKNKLNQEPIKHIPLEWSIDFVTDKLGSGSYGTVYKAKKLKGFIKNHSTKVCAIKIIEKNNFKKVEIDVLNTVEPKCGFLKYYGYGMDDNDNYYIYMEYIEGAISIRDRLKAGYKFSDKEIAEISIKILEAIQHIHNDNIAHRDIKSDHILLIYDNENGNNRLIGIKLIDFGCSKELEVNNTKFCTYVGTDGYMAPEVKSQNGKASCKSDIWSFGCVLLEMLGGDLSIPDKQTTPIVMNTIPLKLKQIIQQCLVLDPNGRSTTDEILRYFRSYKLQVDTKDLSYNLSELIVGVVPDSVYDLNLSSYNHSALKSHFIPTSVTDLNLSSYNHSALSVGVIPNSVEYLYLSSYNHLLSVGVIPNSVEYLNLSSYNHSELAVDVLPDGVENLNLSSYNHALSVGVIPNSVVNLDLSSYNHSALAVGVIPGVVDDLDLSSYNHPLKVGVLPCTVLDLNLSSYNHSALTVGVIPNSVHDLNLSSYNHALTVGVIPNNVHRLNLSSYNHSALTVGVIPDSVHYLNLSSYNHPLTVGVIPNGVQVLSFKLFNQYMESDYIPPSVTSLDLGEEFELSLNGQYLPDDSITTLKCSFDFSKNPNQRVLSTGNYPASVVNLSLPNYNLPLRSSSISKSISALELGSNFKHFETLTYIPSSVIQLSFGDPEFNINETLQSYLLKIKPYIKSTISKLVINDHDVSEQFYQQTTEK